MTIFGHPVYADVNKINEVQHEFSRPSSADAVMAAKRRHEQMVARSLTAFYLPLYCRSEDEEARGGYNEATFGEIADAIRSTPFPCIRILQDEVTRDGRHLLRTDVVCETALLEGGRKFGFAWSAHDRLRRIEGGVWESNYFPLTALQHSALPRSFLELVRALSDRRNGYIEQPMSRQMRRASGVGPTYREYIVVRRKENKGCFTVGHIIRRHPQLHAVRAHLRHYTKTNKTVRVREHARGVGTHLQIKDYRIDET